KAGVIPGLALNQPCTLSAQRFEHIRMPPAHGSRERGQNRRRKRAAITRLVAVGRGPIERAVGVESVDVRRAHPVFARAKTAVNDGRAVVFSSGNWHNCGSHFHLLFWASAREAPPGHPAGRSDHYTL
ncbi:MAG: hypothetical protein WC455_25890, partial [Dehalococcoidia bacterium]